MMKKMMIMAMNRFITSVCFALMGIFSVNAQQSILHEESSSMFVNKVFAVGGICRWDSNKQAAVVLTFDDWTPGQFPIVVPELRKNDLVATFFPIESNIEKNEYSWKAMRSVVKQGNEFGNHTATHPDLTKQTAEQLHEEIAQTKAIIDANIPQQKVVSFAYPFGAGAGYSPTEIQVIDSIRNSGHIGARSVWGMSNYSYEFAKTDDDYYRTQIYGMNQRTTNTQFIAEVEKTMLGGGLLTFLYHSVDDDMNSHNDTWFAQVKQDSLRAQFRYLKNNQDKLWVTTYGNAIAYHREAHSASLSANNVDGQTEYSLTITDTNFLQRVPLECYVPLTVLIYTNGNAVVSVQQGDKQLEIVSKAADYIIFRAMPNGGPIKIL